MLPADYEYVNVSNVSDFITGQIMPARDIDADGTWQDVRYEDYLFLLEVFYERRNWEHASSVSITPYNRALYKNRLNAAILTQNTLNTDRFIDDSVTLPTNTLQNVNNTQTILSIIGESAVSASVPDLTTKRLKADNIRSMFWTAKHATRTYTVIQATEYASSWTSQTIWTKEDGSQSIGPINDYYGMLYNFRKGPRIGSPYNMISITYNSTLKTYPHAVAAKLFVRTSTYMEDSQQYAYDVFPFNCTVNNGAISVPSLNGIAQQACAMHGIFYTTTPQHITSGGGTIEVNDSILVIEHAFPAEVNSLNWDWQPS